MTLKEKSYTDTTKSLSIFLFILSLVFSVSIKAQVTQISIAPSDTNRTIEILSARNLRQITLGNETVLQTLAGNARVRQGNTILEGDSIVLDKSLGIAEVFGNVHINDADSIHTYGQYLQYFTGTRMAHLKKKVKYN